MYVHIICQPEFLHAKIFQQADISGSAVILNNIKKEYISALAFTFNHLKLRDLSKAQKAFYRKGAKNAKQQQGNRLYLLVDYSRWYYNLQ